jgi:hypothetical protein
MRSPLLDIPGALRIIMEIARAIDYAHSRGVVHRDLKPENILFDEQAGGIAKVTDFGLATFFDDSKLTSRFNVTETHVSMGTLSYMAPRAAGGREERRPPRRHLLARRHALRAPGGRGPHRDLRSPEPAPPGHRQAPRRIVLRCLKPSPADRYQRVADLMLDLEPFAPVSFSQVPRKISRVEQLKNQIRAVLRKALRVAEVAVVVAAFAILGISWARSRYHPPPRPSPGTALTAPELRLETATTSPGPIADTSNVRRMVLGEGPDCDPAHRVGPLSPVSRDGPVRFPASLDDVSVGRLNLDLVDRDGISAQLIADVTATAPPSSFWAGSASSSSASAASPSPRWCSWGAPAGTWRSSSPGRASRWRSSGPWARGGGRCSAPRARPEVQRT